MAAPVASPHPSSSVDEDTCRICRSPATPSEPLFHPCKCSGSIKHVHQECLMEWLTHSQKKYCELCKTSFRFTKLYRQDMPHTLPTTVFIRRALIHVLGWLSWWARGALVVLTWGVMLPWSMRFAWRAVFFVSDGGFARDAAFDQMMREVERRNGSTQYFVEDTSTPNDSSSGILSGHPSDLIANFSAGQIVSALLDGVSNTLKTGSANLTRLGMLKQLVRSSHSSRSGGLESLDSNNTRANTTLAALISHRRSSILSEVHFLKTLSGHPRFNRFVMDVLEGQIITLLVVVAFILIFLIREWVVQQQPMLNLQNFDAENAVVPDAANAENGQDTEQQRDSRNHEETRQEEPEIDNPELLASRKQALDWIDALPSELQRAMRQGRVRDVINIVNEMPEDQIAEFKTQISEWQRDIPSQSETSVRSASARVRPGMPSRGRSSLAAEIQRSLVEGQSSDIEAAHTSSGSSSSSWQDVLGSPDEASLEGRKYKGKGRAISDLSNSFYQPSRELETDSLDNLSARAQSSHSPVKSGSSGNSLRADFHGEAPHNESHIDPRDLRAEMLKSDQHGLQASEDDYELEEALNSINTTTPEPPAIPPPQNIFERLCDWFWGDMETEQVNQETPDNDEHVVENIAEEAPFVPFANAQPAVGPLENVAAQNVPEDAAADEAGPEGNDVEVVDEAEDLEGIFELIGMQGPLMGLFQNVMFSACLISLSICIGVWLPYFQGKIVFMILGKPSSLIRSPILLASNIGGVIVDISILVVGLVVHWTSLAVAVVLRVFGWIVPWSNEHTAPLDVVATPASSIAVAASKRLAATVDQLLRAGSIGSALDGLNVNAHLQLSSFQSQFSTLASRAELGILTACHYLAEASMVDLVLRLPIKVCWMVLLLWWHSWGFLQLLLSNIGKILSLSNPPSAPSPVEIVRFAPDVAYWSASDRAIAILTGYLFAAFLGAAYLARGGPFFQDPKFRRVEAVIADALEQAGGVLKVILIISIEMIVFPLYCGLLLDLALLPLSENATLLSRTEFTINRPWTSGFIHWFIGTCYMFHFALFVSMCRKIMRPGVLYFIRDPDDPTFHPVRDVLERSVTSQLRKIALSALVYGALVIFCLGSVVWSLDYLFGTLLPIKWFTNDPTIEFPLDLLFYSFITPFILQIAKPSEGLHKIYTWWFKRCARLLRLSDFLFAEQYTDEQGQLNELDGSEESEEENGEPPAATFRHRDGRFVRAPNSDLVRVPKGTPAFVEVDESNNRLDGKPEEDGIHAKNSELTKVVYLPPSFRARVGLFMFTIWVFAALTGVGVTIIPLIFGRAAIHYLFNPSKPVNDIYAFTLGLYVLGSTIYVATQYSSIYSYLRTHAPSTAPFVSGMRFIGQYSTRAFKIVYIYGTLSFLGPLLCAALLECYVLIPLHAYTGPTQTHAISIIQDWALGVLYGRVFLLSFALTGQDGNSRLSRAARAVFQDGYLDPNVRLATRCFVLPAILLGAVTLGFPALVAFALNHTVFLAHDMTFKRNMVRLSYPALLMTCSGVLFVKYLIRATKRWRGRIRDEVYLVGERLHNFGDKRTVPQNATVTLTTSGD